MNFTKFGNGTKSILVLHEWLGDHRNWLETVKHLDLKKFTFYLLDLPGYGLSSDEKPEFTIATCASQVLSIADDLQLEKFSLVVHSMSGLIGHHLASYHNDKIEKLIMFCPVPPTGFKADAAAIEAMTRVTQDPDALKQAILARGGNIESENWIEAKVKLAQTASTGEVKRGYLNMFTSPIDPEPQFSKVENVTIIYGLNDLPFYSKENLKTAFDPFYKNIEILPVEKVGHYPMLQRPKQVAEILNSKL